MKKPIIQEIHAFGIARLIAALFALVGGSIWANPQGMTVASGSAHSTQQGNTLQITTSQNTFLNWNSFNIAPGETTIFKEPSATSIVFNNIKNGNPTSIFGSLQANGIVVLENQSGFYFGPNAFVKAGGLVVTTAAVNPWASGGGAGWSFDGPPTAAPIVNYGQLETASGGSLFLIGKHIENYGGISAPGGTAALVAGQEVLLSARPDGLSLSAPVHLPAGSVDNQGRITADAGTVLLQAETVNNSGVVQANSVREKNGVIELYASQEIELSGTSVLQANGDSAGISPGGDITIKSGGTFSDTPGSQITAAGGANGGSGGNVEVSAANILSLDSTINVNSQPGWTGGAFTLDPENIVLGTTGTTGPDSSGSINGTGGSGTLDVNVNTAFQNITAGQILLEASGNITLNPGTTWDLSQSTGKTTGQLTLEAGGDITLGATGGSPATITDENNWSVTLEAGYNFAAGHGVVSGMGNVNLAGSAGVSGSTIETATGNITVLAGKNVTVGVGGIVTGVADGVVISGTGGNINVQAVAGNVNCGTSEAGYTFGKSGYKVNPSLGGISTASGGNVNIQAGGNITAVMPTAGDAGSGAFGADPGNVTLTAGGNVVGHYVLADGTGTITANNAGTASTGLALSLINGGWLVDAANNITLQEVRNPNGVFNSAGSANSPFHYLFDYNPLASVVLDAGNNVTITGGGPRTSGASEEGLIFPPSLTIESGAGGITLDANITLFPSPEGGLVMTTTGGGSLNGNNNYICVSDSPSDHYLNGNSFTSGDTANDALHLHDPNPVFINVSGSVSDFTLYSPKAVEMLVADNMIDSSAVIENLRPTDTSLISVGGEILDHSSYVILNLPSGETPDFTELNEVSAPTITTPQGVVLPNPNLIPALNGANGQFLYDQSSGSLKYAGVMSSAVEQALLALPTPFLPAAIIESIYTQSQLESPATQLGIAVTGPGTLRINAASLDLGNSAGVSSLGITSSPALAPYTARGADIDINLAGNLSMLASAITSDYGGNINITCGGTVDVGSLLVPSVNSQTPLGIVSLYSGNISVIAQGDVNVEGSRIAAYDGGNIFVESLQGNVNAGTGGGSAVLVNKPYLNAQGGVSLLSEVIPGSGILATSYPELAPGETSSQIGSITVETPQGDIIASQGGIVQLALGSTAHNDATINLNAGSRNSDGSIAYVGNVDASGSGVIGGEVNINATGNINGLVVASISASVTAALNVNATVLSQGGASVSAGGTASGTVVGLSSVSVKGGTGDTASALSAGSVSQSGTPSGGAVAAAPTGSNSNNSAATQTQAAQSTPASTQVADNSESEEAKKKRARASKLKEYVGRVTVLLPE